MKLRALYEPSGTKKAYKSIGCVSFFDFEPLGSPAGACAYVLRPLMNTPRGQSVNQTVFSSTGRRFPSGAA